MKKDKKGIYEIWLLKINTVKKVATVYNEQDACRVADDLRGDYTPSALVEIREVINYNEYIIVYQEHGTNGGGYELL